MSVVLVDKSAFEQRHHPEAAQILDTLVSHAALAICEVVALELLYSATSSEDYRRRRRGLALWRWLPIDNQAMTRAFEVQGLLAARGQHRRPIPDLIVAATAEVNGAEVLHYDRDFDLIAEVTGQPVRWILPRGSGH